MLARTAFEKDGQGSRTAVYFDASLNADGRLLATL